MSLVNISQALNVEAFRQALSETIEGEIRFDKVSRALYSTDASVYQIEPVGVAIPKTREDLIRIVEVCRRFRCPLDSAADEARS